MIKNSLNIDDLLSSYHSGYSFQADFYNQRYLYETELEAIFYRNWIYAGHHSQLPDAGCFMTLEFGNESIIIVRGKDQTIRAFANVCRHRGSRVCLKASGKTSAFVCPYHAWTYDLGGKLRSKRDMPTGFDRSQYSLHSIPCEVFEGMIFINLDSKATRFTADLAPLSPALAIYQIANTKIACQQTFSVQANWKLAVENFMECYHCAPAHPEYANSHALQSPKDYIDLTPAMIAESKSLGYHIEMTSNDGLDEIKTPYFYNRSAMYEGYVTGSKSGQPVAPLLGNIKQYGGGAADIQLGPLTYAIFYPDHAVLYRFLPIDLHHTAMEIIWLVHQNATEDKDYDLDDLTWLWAVTSEADKRIITDNQKGINSKFYQPGPLAKTEHYITSFADWYIAQMQSYQTKNLG